MNSGISPENKCAICRILASCPKVSEIILFGSRAMGTFKPYSDIDLCLRGSDISLDDILSLRVKLQELPLVVDIDLVAECLLQSPALLQHIKLKGLSWWKTNES